MLAATPIPTTTTLARGRLARRLPRRACVASSSDESIKLACVIGVDVGVLVIVCSYLALMVVRQTAQREKTTLPVGTNDWRATARRNLSKRKTTTGRRRCCCCCCRPVNSKQQQRLAATKAHHSIRQSENNGPYEAAIQRQVAHTQQPARLLVARDERFALPASQSVCVCRAQTFALLR